MLSGIGVSLEIACVSVLIAGVIGTLAGVVAGFLGRWTSAVIMRITDMLFAIPAILLALIVVAALGAGWSTVPIAIGVGYIPIFVRVVRGPVLTLRESGYVFGWKSARVLACQAVVPAHSAKCRRNPGRAGEPRPCLVHSRGGEPQFSRTRSPASNSIARRDGLFLSQFRFGRDRLVDSGVSFGGHCRRRDRFQSARGRATRRHRPSDEKAVSSMGSLWEAQL